MPKIGVAAQPKVAFQSRAICLTPAFRPGDLRARASFGYDLHQSGTLAWSCAPVRTPAHHHRLITL